MNEDRRRCQRKANTIAAKKDVPLLAVYILPRRAPLPYQRYSLSHAVTLLRFANLSGMLRLIFVTHWQRYADTRGRRDHSRSAARMPHDVWLAKCLGCKADEVKAVEPALWNEASLDSCSPTDEHGLGVRIPFRDDLTGDTEGHPFLRDQDFGQC